MSDKKFQAILAKNQIAREIKSYLSAPAGEREPIHIHYIIHELKTIEQFLGEANQPCVADIIQSSMAI